MAPPLYRHQPLWYQRNLTQVATRFSQTFSVDVQPNFRLLPAFPCQDLMPDGVFLDPVSGLHFVLHLFDQAELILAQSSLGGEAQFAQVRESVRHHEDRMAFIENRHNLLQNQSDHKTAVDAEFNDWVLNRSEEDWFTIKGLPRLTQVATSEWQNAARRQVTEVIKHVLDVNRVRLDFTVLLVVNPFRHLTSGQTTYNIRMNSAFVSQRIRDLFSGFFRHNRPVKLPHDLKGVSIRNKITKETKIRIEILRYLGEIYKASNPGSSYHLRGYDSRPLLAIFPPQNSGGRQRTFNFIQAATTLSHRFSDEHLTQIHQVIGNSCMGRLRALFIVISDDDRARCTELVAQARNSGRNRGRRGAVAQDPSRPGSGSGASASVHFAEVQTASGSIHGQGSGASLEAGFLESLRSKPPPPPSDWTQTTSRSPDASKQDRDSRTALRSRSRSRSGSAHLSQKSSRRSRSRSGSHESKRRSKRSRSRSSSSHEPKKRSKRSRSRSCSSPELKKKRSHRSKGKPKSSRHRRTPSPSPSSSGSSRSSRSPSPPRKTKSKDKDSRSKK